MAETDMAGGQTSVTKVWRLGHPDWSSPARRSSLDCPKRPRPVVRPGWRKR